MTEPVQGTFAVGQPGANIPPRALKGGFHLCAPNYCLRYGPAARQAENVGTSTGHIGFRSMILPASFTLDDALEKMNESVSGAGH